MSSQIHQNNSTEVEAAANHLSPLPLQAPHLPLSGLLLCGSRGRGPLLPGVGGEEAEDAEHLLKLQNQRSGHIPFQDVLKPPQVSGQNSGPMEAALALEGNLTRPSWSCRPWVLPEGPQLWDFLVNHFQDEEVELIKKMGALTDSSVADPNGLQILRLAPAQTHRQPDQPLQYQQLQPGSLEDATWVVRRAPRRHPAPERRGFPSVILHSFEKEDHILAQIYDKVIFPKIQQPEQVEGEEEAHVQDVTPADTSKVIKSSPGERPFRCHGRLRESRRHSRVPRPPAARALLLAK
ncbi:hypothetical protein QTO34_014788 [Cnephaeus nilssonii]|uniref:Ferritin light chain n=1 Tax=Cnephaeus nilssonii TaxID=3371016 RepID=A0AA40I704_CNENI|nr:hypothetical protein QTO34_014788 [Eptesicus nilssonii]